MAHTFDEASWQAMPPQEKLNVLHEDIRKLYGLIEGLSHKDHMLVDAFNLLHSRIEDQEKALRKVKAHSEAAEP
jgi:hypothetical protein